MVSKDWVKDAAEEIYHGGPHGEHHDSSPEAIAAVIERHCPFKKVVGYVRIPDCGSHDGVHALVSIVQPLFEAHVCDGTEYCLGCLRTVVDEALGQ